MEFWVSATATFISVLQTPCKLVGGGGKRILCGILHSSSNTCHYTGYTLESKELTNANGFQLKDLFRKRCSRYFRLNSSPSLQCLQCICDNCHVKHRLKLLLRPKGKKLLTFGVDLQTKLMESLFQIYVGTRGSVSKCCFCIGLLRFDTLFCLSDRRWPPQYIFCRLSLGVALETD